MNNNNKLNPNQGYLSNNARNALFDSPVSSRKFGEPSNSNTYNSFSNQEIFDKQKQQMQDQDAYLDALSGSVLRSKDMAIQIGTTAEQQTKELEQLNVHVDKTSLSLRNATRNVIKLGEQAQTTGYWVTICLLFLALIVVSALAMAT
ncbi:syntaxin 8 [Tieghemostelium lacteum]|uniref:Syntaxin 8 n=1 Tax=Tieghemostelium lacteum TaxID=361077 RepID=A0A151ZGM6_TIELA|nr:syntaxin 8 [Tieghemostelium lacteum]|eukprot:KYQ93126.1 syntaxin 8 [Tieghemostelium lacteum]